MMMQLTSDERRGVKVVHRNEDRKESIVVQTRLRFERATALLFEKSSCQG
jgi:hypothetical protein